MSSRVSDFRDEPHHPSLRSPPLRILFLRTNASPSHRTTASPTSSIHLRSLPVPPTPSSTKPPVPPVAHYAQLFQSRIPRPRACLFDTTSPTSGTFTILHTSPKRLLLPRVATRLQYTRQTPTKLLRERVPFASSGRRPDPPRRCGPISEYPHKHLGARVCAGVKHQSRPVQIRVTAIRSICHSHTARLTCAFTAAAAWVEQGRRHRGRMTT